MENVMQGYEIIEFYPPALFIQFASGVEFTSADLADALQDPLLDAERLGKCPLVVFILRTTYELTSLKAAFLCFVHDRVTKGAKTAFGVILPADTPRVLRQFKYVAPLLQPCNEYPSISAVQDWTSPRAGS
ncbi:MAG: hypothetical protein HY341_01480 [Candidatus Kerfeldbacteria bacterium]|nr:hypothetical protein [Candidatus Kerfeldbacteria bacterium]